MTNNLRIIFSSFNLQLRDAVTGNTVLFSLAIQPILFAILSVGLFLYAEQADLSLYALIGSGMIGMWNANLWSSGFIVQRERRGGMLEILLSTPSSMMLILFGKSLSNAVISLLSIFLTFVTGALAFRVPLGINDPLGFVFILLLTTLSVACLGLILATLFVLSRAAIGLSGALNYPIFILSGFMFPITLLPVWTRVFSYSLATTWGSEGLAQTVGLSNSNFWLICLYLLGLSLLYYLIGWRLYQTIERIVRRLGGLSVY